MAQNKLPGEKVRKRIEQSIAGQRQFNDQFLAQLLGLKNSLRHISMVNLHDSKGTATDIIAAAQKLIREIENVQSALGAGEGHLTEAIAGFADNTSFEDILNMLSIIFCEQEYFTHHIPTVAAVLEMVTLPVLTGAIESLPPGRQNEITAALLRWIFRRMPAEMFRDLWAALPVERQMELSGLGDNGTG